MAGRFEGKSVIVTGGAGGIGRAACLGFAAEGGSILVADMDVAEGERTAALVREAGGRALFRQWMSAGASNAPAWLRLRSQLTVASMSRLTMPGSAAAALRCTKRRSSPSIG
jgi:NAD(P)-dependent dehydrogenase (short-subunit alcohol dehydrogenase family)